MVYSSIIAASFTALAISAVCEDLSPPRSGQGRIYGVAPLLKLLVKQLAI